MAQDGVPYVSIDWMRNYLQRIRRSAATVLDKEVAAQAGATGNNWTQLLRAARELGIVDDEGRLTEEVGLGLAAGGKRAEQAAREIVTHTYPSLVPRLQAPLSAEELKLHFYDISRRNRGQPLGESARRQAVALFRFWVEQSGEPAWLAYLNAPHAPRSEASPVAHVPRRAPRTHAAPAPEDGSEPLEEAIEERMPFYHATISIPAGRRLTPDEWEFVRTSLSAKIGFLKARANSAPAGDEH